MSAIGRQRFKGSTCRFAVDAFASQARRSFVIRRTGLAEAAPRSRPKGTGKPDPRRASFDALIGQDADPGTGGRVTTTVNRCPGHPRILQTRDTLKRRRTIPHGIPLRLHGSPPTATAPFLSRSRRRRARRGCRDHYMVGHDSHGSAVSRLKGAENLLHPAPVGAPHMSVRPSAGGYLLPRKKITASSWLVDGPPRYVHRALPAGTNPSKWWRLGPRTARRHRIQKPFRLRVLRIACSRCRRFSWSKSARALRPRPW